VEAVRVACLLSHCLGFLRSRQLRGGARQVIGAVQEGTHRAA